MVVEITVMENFMGKALADSHIGNREGGPHAFKMISLFAGCGGKDKGFLGGFDFLGTEYRTNPIKIVFANEVNKFACDAYKDNFYHVPLCKDIRHVSTEEIPDADIVVGGVPCQDFSLAGKRRGLKSKRGRLYLELLRVVRDKQPIIFVMENVTGMKEMSNGSVVSQIKKDFKKAGYRVHDYLLNAADYGVPQKRERLFIVGVRDDFDVKFAPPRPTHEHDPITARSAINDLISKPDFPNQAEYSRARNYGERLQGNKKIAGDKPSITIRAEHHGNIEFHYSENRRLTVRECARLQSFPDSFKFNCSAAQSYRQIGNAVPPVLAWHIAQSVIKLLTEVKSAEGQESHVKDNVSDQKRRDETGEGVGERALVEGVEVSEARQNSVW